MKLYQKVMWGSFAVSLCVGLAVACGSSSDTDSNGNDGPEAGSNPVDSSFGNDSNASADGTFGSDTSSNTDSALSDGSIADGGLLADGGCFSNGMSCSQSSQCCSSSCDQATSTCVAPAGVCSPAGVSCSKATDCCSYNCTGGVCSVFLCTSDNQPCTTGAQCCGGTCSANDAGVNVCKPLNALCKTSGNTCAASAECCGKACINGICNGTVSYCAQNGDVCSTNTECCGGLCNKASDAGATLGTCGVPAAPGATQCDIAGSVCGSGIAGLGDAGFPECGGTCCSSMCAPYGPTGVMICQPPSGCHPVGEVCVTDRDCCGGPGLPGGNGSAQCVRGNVSDPVGRCSNGTSTNPNGAICKLPGPGGCSAPAVCWEGNINNNPTPCVQDNLGIPRCSHPQNCGALDASTLVNQSCSTSSDCCGLSCVPSGYSDGGAPFVCGSSCVAVDNRCTTNGDCCPGNFCYTQLGSTQGLCKPNTFVTYPDGGTSSGTTDAGTTDGGDAGASNPDSGLNCSLYGQTCTVTANCCNGVPCISGRCRTP